MSHTNVIRCMPGISIVLPDGFEIVSAEPPKLFEIITNSIGESFVRSYAWCRSVGEARAMFERMGTKHAIAEIRELLSAGDESVIFTPSDSGFGDQFH